MPPAWRWQFGLGKLILVSNVLGIALAIVIISHGKAFAFAVGLGILAGFLAPMLVLGYISLTALLDRFFASRIANEFERKGLMNDPFAD